MLRLDLLETLVFSINLYIHNRVKDVESGAALADALLDFAAQPNRVRQGGPYGTPFRTSRTPAGRMRT